MKVKVYSMYDSKVVAYLQPFFMQAKGAAIRAFTDALGDENSQFCKHPGDYTLFELGEWDDANACFDMYDTPVSIGTGLEFKSQSQV